MRSTRGTPVPAPLPWLLGPARRPAWLRVQVWTGILMRHRDREVRRQVSVPKSPGSARPRLPRDAVRGDPPRAGATRCVHRSFRKVLTANLDKELGA